MPITTISSTIITQANNTNSMQKNHNLSLEDVNNNRDINVSMLIMLKNTVNFEKDKKNNHSALSNSKENIKTYTHAVVTFPAPFFKNFNISNNNKRIKLNKTVVTSPTTTTTNTATSSVRIVSLFKKENNYDEYFLLDKSTRPLDLIKSSFTTPKALASAKNIYNIKKNGELSAIFNTITASVNHIDALINSNNNNNYNVGEIQKGEKVYSIIDISERMSPPLSSSPASSRSTSVAPKAISIITTTFTSTVTSTTINDSDIGIIVIEDMESATDINDTIVISTIAAVKNVTREITNSFSITTITTAVIPTNTPVNFAFTTPNAVINMSASAQLKNNDRYEMPLTMRFAPNYKIGKKLSTKKSIVRV